MTGISQIRNQVHQLQRKFSNELLVFRLRQIAQEIANDWEISMDEKEELPQPHQVIRRVASHGHLLSTYTNLGKYVQRRLDQGKCLIHHKRGYQVRHPRPLERAGVTTWYDVLTSRSDTLQTNLTCRESRKGVINPVPVDRGNCSTNPLTFQTPASHSTSMSVEADPLWR